MSAATVEELARQLEETRRERDEAVLAAKRCQADARLQHAQAKAMGADLTRVAGERDTLHAALVAMHQDITRALYPAPTTPEDVTR